jgi:hypothetical protein
MRKFTVMGPRAAGTRSGFPCWICSVSELNISAKAERYRLCAAEHERLAGECAVPEQQALLRRVAQSYTALAEQEDCLAAQLLRHLHDATECPGRKRAIEPPTSRQDFPGEHRKNGTNESSA